jgi:hypothetical protein
MRRAAALPIIASLAVTLCGQDHVLRGRIRQEAGKPPLLITGEGKGFIVTGDQFTRGQMADPKLNGRQIELEGRPGGPAAFEARRIFTIKDGKRHKVTYWCDICSIRTHMPGRCMCCQADTELQELPVP